MTPPASTEPVFGILLSELNEWEQENLCWSEVQDLQRRIRARGPVQQAPAAINSICDRAYLIDGKILCDGRMRCDHQESKMNEMGLPFPYVLCGRLDDINEALESDDVSCIHCFYCGKQVSTFHKGIILRGIATCPECVESGKDVDPEHDAALIAQEREKWERERAEAHRTYESCHKHFACPDGEECWYSSADYYWDCGNGAARVFEAVQKAKAQAREDVLKRLHLVVPLCDALIEKFDCQSQLGFNALLIKRELESLRSEVRK